MFLLNKRFFAFSISKFNSQKDYYKVLGISTSADQKQIKKSFRDLAKKYHPDSSSGNQEKFKQVNEAYQVLSDQGVKREYDETRSYGSSSGHQSSNYGYGSQQQRQSGYQNVYQNYNNSSSNYSQQYNQAYNRSGAHPSYRGYTRADGWQNQRYRQDIMNQIFKQYQSQMYKAAQRQRQKYGSYSDTYSRHAENIRQYTQQMKRRQETIRKAYQQQQQRRQRQFRQYQQKEARQLQQKLNKKLNDLKDGIVKNVHGFIRVGEFLKDTWQNIKKDFNKKDNNDGKKK